MIDSLMDALIDTLKLLPYLLITFIILELIEHKFNKKQEIILKENKKLGPLLGGVLGALPQCGFSTMAANMYPSRIITTGTLIAVFLSTSDEMLPIMIGEHVNVVSMLGIIGFKVLIGIIAGYIIDIILRNKMIMPTEDIHSMCEDDHCSCENHGVFLSSLKHTLKVGLFILVANILINLIIFKIGEDNLSNILTHKNILTYFACSLVGLIPNCASSVIMTELYLSKLISLGNLFSGLLTGSGLGILLLFKTNKNIKENISILSIIYFIGVVVGIIVDLVI